MRGRARPVYKYCENTPYRCFTGDTRAKCTRPLWSAYYISSSDSPSSPQPLPPSLSHVLFLSLLCEIRTGEIIPRVPLTLYCMTYFNVSKIPV